MSEVQAGQFFGNRTIGDLAADGPRRTVLVLPGRSRRGRIASVLLLLAVITKVEVC